MLLLAVVVDFAAVGAALSFAAGRAVIACDYALPLKAAVCNGVDLNNCWELAIRTCSHYFHSQQLFSTVDSGA